MDEACVDGCRAGRLVDPVIMPTLRITTAGGAEFRLPAVDRSLLVAVFAARAHPPWNIVA